MSKKFIYPVLFILIIALAIVYRQFGLDQYLSLDYLKIQHEALLAYYQDHPLKMILFYVLAYSTFTTLMIPGATVLTLAAGAIFGFGIGSVLVSIGSTVGAATSFLASRFLFRDFIQSRMHRQFEVVNQGIKKDGLFYLLTVRLIPLFPYFIINVMMGLTNIRFIPYMLVSWIGMIPATMVYVNAGTQLGQLHSIRGILSPDLILSFILIGIFPLLAKWSIDYWKSLKYMRKYRKPKRFDYNLVVIGAGSAGLVSSYIASTVKAKVALIEKHKMGGDCLNTGCIPSKALIRSAKIYSYFKRAQEFGLEVDPAKVDLSKVMQWVQKTITQIEPHDSIERYRGLGVDCFSGEAKILSPYEVSINGKHLFTKNIILATGASPLVPKIEGLSDVPYLTSDTLWSLIELPKKLLILGGGPIGCELAQSFCRFGSQVTIVEMNSNILSKEDPDVSGHISKKFETEGIRILTNYKAIRVEQGVLTCEHLGKEQKIEFDEILLALGRKARVEGFGLEQLGVELSKSETVVADDYMRTTNYPNIFVCGDVTGPYQFTHVASHQAWYASVNALFAPFKKFKVDYRVIPWCTFTDPEVARVGLSEQEAKAKNISFELSHYDIGDLDRALTEGAAEGFIKVLTEPGRDRILGVTIVGHHAGDIIAEFVMAMKFGIGLNKILSTIHIYPTLSEANKYVAGVWRKKNAPAFALRILKIYHKLRRS